MTAAALLQMRFSAADLPSVRLRLAHAAALAGLDESRCEELVLAAYELVSNAVKHGGGGGTLRLTRVGGYLRCQVTDQGRGFVPARDSPDSPGCGLWMARQLTDGIEIDSGAAGTVVTLAVRCREPAAPSQHRP